MILSLDNYIASAKEIQSYIKTTARTTVTLFPFSMFDIAGNPGAGVLAGTNVANGVVPTQGQAGYPAISAFGGGATGYLTRVTFNNSVVGQLMLYDRLFVAGAYAFNDNQALTAQPSFAGRLPGGNNFNGLQIWVEQVTAATGNQAVNVTYTNQSGATGRTTGAVGIGAAPTVGRCWMLPLQPGDSGVQRIDNVVGSVATAGTFNVMVLRPLWNADLLVANVGGVHDLMATGMPVVTRDTALYLMVNAVGTSSGLPRIYTEISNR